jgi:hypothetical protein
VDLPAASHQFVEDADVISSGRLKRLFDYWNTLKGARIAPARTDLKPADMREHLVWIWLMDAGNNGEEFRFRMGGDRVVQFFGNHLGGASVKDVLPNAPAFFGRFLDVVTLAAKSAKPVLAGPGQVPYEEKAFFEMEALLLPLSDDGVNVTGLLGGMEIRPLAKAVEPRD